MNVGVLALQGDVPEHQAAVARVVGPAHVRSIRTPEDLDAVDALTLPGGESTTIAALLEHAGLWRPLADRMAHGLPVLATCAGLILLARRLERSPGGRDPPTFGVLDITVRRNDYGTQGDSFEGAVRVAGIEGEFPGVFIRAPRIVHVGSKATAVARRDSEVVGVRQGKLVGLTFHPELGEDPRLHAWFFEEVARGRPRKR